MSVFNVYCQNVFRISMNGSKSRCSIHENDLTLMKNFKHWISGNDFLHIPINSSPNCIVSMVH